MDGNGSPDRPIHVELQPQADDDTLLLEEFFLFDYGTEVRNTCWLDYLVR